MNLIEKNKNIKKENKITKLLNIECHFIKKIKNYLHIIL